MGSLASPGARHGWGCVCACECVCMRALCASMAQNFRGNHSQKLLHMCVCVRVSRTRMRVNPRGCWLSSVLHLFAKESLCEYLMKESRIFGLLRRFYYMHAFRVRKSRRDCAHELAVAFRRHVVGDFHLINRLIAVSVSYKLVCLHIAF